MDDFAKEVRKASRGSDSEDHGPRLTSFPRLQPRHCTVEWISTSADSDNPMSNIHADVTNLIIHSHAGPSSAATKASSSVEPRMGFGIGTAAHQRRSSVKDEHVHTKESFEGTSLLGKLRDQGHKLLHRHHEDERGSAGPLDTLAESSSASPGSELPTPQNSLAAELRSVETGLSLPRSRDSIVRERTPEIPTADKVGIYHAMTGSRVIQRDRTHTCSEDCRPHVCADDLPFNEESHSSG